MSKPSGNNFIKLKTSHHLICFHITRLNVKRYRIDMCSRIHCCVFSITQECYVLSTITR
jgi:hypothetical protein